MGLRIPSMSDIMTVARSRGMNSNATGLWKGAAALYPGQEGRGDKLSDVAGNRSHGTLTNMDPATDWVMTEKGWAFVCDGDGVSGGNNNVEISPAAQPAAAPLSIGMWLRNDQGTNDTVGVFYSSDVAGLDLSFGFLSTGLGYITAGNIDTAATYREVVAANLPAAGSLFHFLYTYDGTASAIYINGVGGLDQASDVARIWLHSDDSKIHLGCRMRTTYNTALNGVIAGCTIHSRIPTPPEIQQLADPVACWDMYTPRIEVFAAAVAEEGVTVSVTLGAVAIAGFAPEVEVGTTVAVTLGAVALAGFNASLPTEVDCTVDAITLASFAAEVEVGTTVAVSLGTVTVLGFNPAVVLGGTIDCTLGTVVIAGCEAEVEQGTTIDLSLGAVAIASFGSGVISTTTVSVTQGAVAVLGFAARLWHDTVEDGFARVDEAPATFPRSGESDLNYPRLDEPPDTYRRV